MKGMVWAVSKRLERVLVRTLEAVRADGAFSGDLPPVVLERPKRPEHGDQSTNIALVLANRAGIKPPRKLAEHIRSRLDDPEGLVAAVEIAGPGFLNFRIADRVWRDALGEVLAAGADFGRGPPGRDAPRVLIEYVSANPTGPLHVGHGRCAAIGDVRILVDLAVLSTYVSLFSLSRFIYRMYVLGHNLDPQAAMKVEPFTPAIFGTKQIANFTVSSYPRGASVMIAAFVTGVCVVAVWVLLRGRNQALREARTGAT